jgi:hypothetical protein
MPSFLTNSKMPHALATRVQSSVGGLRRGHGARVYAPTRTAIVRISVVALVLLAFGAVWQERRDRAQQLASAKHALLQTRAELRATLTPNAYTLAERARLILRRESNDFAGSLRDEALSTGKDWDALLLRRIIYARLPTDSVNQPDKLESLLSESQPDAFVLCLKEPAVDSTEKALMKRINVVFGDSGATKEQLVNIHSAFDAIVTLQLFEPSFDAQVEQAEELKPVLDLQHMWNKAHVDERLPAVFAEVLIALLDEPKVENTPVELDGASVHNVRVIVADLSRDKEKMLFRARYAMDPSWVSERRRHQYAQALGSCRVASEVRNPSELVNVAK